MTGVGEEKQKKTDGWRKTVRGDYQQRKSDRWMEKNSEGRLSTEKERGAKRGGRGGREREIKKKRQVEGKKVMEVEQSVRDKGLSLTSGTHKWCQKPRLTLCTK